MNCLSRFPTSASRRLSPLKSHPLPKKKNPRPPSPSSNNYTFLLLSSPLPPILPPFYGESSSSTSLPCWCPSSPWSTPWTSSSQWPFANATAITRQDYACAPLRPERKYLVGNRFVLHRAYQICHGRKLRPQTGSTCELQGDSDGALFAYERALHHNYQSIQALNAISCILRTKENFPRAVEYLQTILKLDQSNGEVWGSLGSYTHVMRWSNMTDEDKATASS